LSFDVTDVGPTDGRVVVLLHGFPQDRRCWNGIVPALVQAGYRVLAPDQRGYSPGARPRGRKAYTVDELCLDALALADVAGAHRFDVVGHDWGGIVAWNLAARYPERVTSVVALSTPHPRAFRDALLRSRQALRSWYMLMFQLPGLPEALLRLAGKSRVERGMIRDGLDPQAAGEYAARVVTPDAVRGPINWYRALPYALREPLPDVKVPTLYVWSDGDHYLTRAAADATANYVTARYRFEVLAGVSHWIPDTAAEKVTPLILGHLADAPG
jgi:pimeloyl-ACP methyl ester carboxylesterase